MGHKLAESLLLLKNYVDGNLTTTTSGLNNESPPLALAPVNSSDKTSNRRRSLGTTTPVNRTILRRANTFKSTTSLTK
uniref:Uncharacterized protein n=1 Tax=Panagrolaimus sp. JU765 TaxID=591449 RepID=A0AC34RC50_9BILA